MLADVTAVLVSLYVASLHCHASALVTPQSIVSRSPNFQTPGAAGEYQYAGCFTDNAGARSLTAYRTRSNTIEECLAFCEYADGSWGKLTYMGVEYGSECYCDWVLQDGAVQVDDSECNVPCVGNASQPCGGANRLTLFALPSGSPTTAPAIVEWSPRKWAYQGCYRDSHAIRVLPHQIGNIEQHGLSLGYCADACAYLGYSYAGMEYRRECWCGHDPQLQNFVKGADSECGMACYYSPTQRCGAPDRLSLYKSIE